MYAICFCLKLFLCAVNPWMCRVTFDGVVTLSKCVSLSSPLLEPGKHKHRKCERPLSAQPSKPVIVRPGSKRYESSSRSPARGTPTQANPFLSWLTRTIVSIISFMSWLGWWVLWRATLPIFHVRVCFQVSGSVAAHVKKAVWSLLWWQRKLHVIR